MRLGCWGLLIGLALTFGGGQEVYENWVSGKRVDTTFARLNADLPGSGWYKVGDAHWTLADAVLLQNKMTGSTSEDLYAPVEATVAEVPVTGEPRPEEAAKPAPAPEKVHALVHVTDVGLANTDDGHLVPE